MLHFRKLTLENFGPYKGFQEIDFTSEDGVTIIWGNNGKGKTTLLNVFRYALFGKVQGRGAKNHSLKQIANWESFEDGEYGFKVILKMDNDGIDYELTRQFVVKELISKPEKDSDYREEVFLKRGTSILSPDERTHSLKALMPEKVSRFFLFDGELLQEYEELLSDENSIGTKIKEAIETILGVPVLTNGLIDTREAVNEYSKQKSKAAQKDQKTQLLGNALEAKQVELKTHEDELANLRQKLSEFTDDKQALEEELKQTEKVRDWLNEKDRLTDTVERKKVTRATKLNEMKELTKIAWQGMLSQRIKAVLEDLNTEIKIYEDKRSKHLISEQLIQEIKKGCETGLCPICEQPLAGEYLDRIKEKSASYDSGFSGLSEEEENKLIELQGRRSQLMKLSVEELKIQISYIEGTLADLLVETADLEKIISDLNKNIAEAGDTTRASTISNDYARCLQKIDNTEAGIKAENEKIAQITTELKSIDDKLNKQASEGELLTAKLKSEICEKIMKIFEKGVDLYRDNLKQKVEKDASNIFVSIANEPDYERLQINDNYGLAIVHRSGRIVEIRSAGYEHIVALSLIGALHKNAPLQGPIIMDSPFGRLDPEHKQKITAALPDLAEQVMLLVYSGEIDEQLARSILGGNLKKEYCLVRKSAFNTKIKMGGINNG